MEHFALRMLIQKINEKQIECLRLLTQYRGDDESDNSTFAKQAIQDTSNETKKIDTILFLSLRSFCRFIRFAKHAEILDSRTLETLSGFLGVSIRLLAKILL